MFYGFTVHHSVPQLFPLPLTPWSEKKRGGEGGLLNYDKRAGGQAFGLTIYIK